MKLTASDVGHFHQSIVACGGLFVQGKPYQILELSSVRTVELAECTGGFEED